MTFTSSVERDAFDAFGIKRMLLVLMVSSLACSALTSAACAQDAEEIEIETLTQRADGFFSTLTDLGLTSPEDQKSVFDDLLDGGPLADRDAEVTQLVQRYNELVEKHGGYAGRVEQISAKRFTQDLVLLKYLYKANNFPIIWYITFYRPQRTEGQPTEGWAVVSLRFDTRLELLDLTE